MRTSGPRQPLFHAQNSAHFSQVLNQKILLFSSLQLSPGTFPHTHTRKHTISRLFLVLSLMPFSSEVSQGFLSPPPPPSLSAKQTNRQETQSPCAFYRNSWQIKEKSPRLLSLRSELCLSTHTRSSQQGSPLHQMDPRRQRVDARWVEKHTWTRWTRRLVNRSLHV